ANSPQPRQQMPQAERGFRQVPQPSTRQEIQRQPVAPANAGRGVPQPPVNRNTGEQMAPQYHSVPRPPQNNNVSQPGFRPFGTTQGDSHPVPRPPAQENRQQPGFRQFSAPQAQPHAVPQP